MTIFSKENMDIAVLGLILGSTVLAALKLRHGAPRTRIIALSGFVLLSAVSGARVIDHLASETPGPENSSLVIAMDAFVTLLGLALILRGMSEWKKRTARKPVLEAGSEAAYSSATNSETSQVVSFRKLHGVSCNLARRIETLSAEEAQPSRPRVSALEELFEACGENLAGVFDYDCLTVELAPPNGTTAHSLASDTGGSALKAHYYPMRQSLVRMAEIEDENPLLICKSKTNSRLPCWARLDSPNVMESLMGSIRIGKGYCLTIAAGSCRERSFDREGQFIFGEFLKLVRPLALAALSRARSEAEKESAASCVTSRRTAADHRAPFAAKRLTLTDASPIPAASAVSERSDKT